MFRLLGVLAAASTVYGLVVLATHLRHPSQSDWPLWRAVALDTLGSALCAAVLLHLA